MSCKYRNLFKILKINGWTIQRQKGSHIHFSHNTHRNIVTVPFHGGRDISKNLLKLILKQAFIMEGIINENC
jgi:predicted RNA binding protein YcfA (HicA-like mRNA interferase family)